MANLVVMVSFLLRVPAAEFAVETSADEGEEKDALLTWWPFLLLARGDTEADDEDEDDVVVLNKSESAFEPSTAFLHALQAYKIM